MRELIRLPKGALKIACIDRGSAHRRELSETYKGTRTKIDDDMRVQIPHVVDAFRCFGYHIAGVEGFEADDVIATLATRYRGENIEIHTMDKDMLQLVGENTIVYDPIKDVAIDSDAVYKKYGISPEQFIDYQTMVGDIVDNISGIKGIGPKTSVKLLNEFGKLDNIVGVLLVDRARDDGTLEKMRRLVTLATDLDIEEHEPYDVDVNAVIGFLDQYGFMNLQKKMHTILESNGYRRNDEGHLLGPDQEGSGDGGHDISEEVDSGDC